VYKKNASSFALRFRLFIKYFKKKMSSMISSAFQYVFGKEKKHTLMLGLDNAGWLCLI